MIDQMTGKLSPPILTTNSSGRCSAWAIHIPTSAPMKPSAIDTRQPPWLYPAIAWPIEPHMPATSKRIRSDISVIGHKVAAVVTS